MIQILCYAICFLVMIYSDKFKGCNIAMGIFHSITISSTDVKMTINFILLAMVFQISNSFSFIWVKAFFKLLRKWESYNTLVHLKTFHFHGIFIKSPMNIESWMESQITFTYTLSFIWINLLIWNLTWAVFSVDSVE